MAFSLGSVLGGLQSAASLAGTVSNLVGGVSGLFGLKQAPAIAPGLTAAQKGFKLESIAAQAGTSAGGNVVALPRRGTPVVRLPGLGLPAVQTRLGRILAQARQFTGGSVTAQAIRAAALTCGLAVAADLFGLTETDVCEVVISKRRRRSRGISAADMRRTRSTLRKICSISRQVKEVTGRKRIC